LFDEPFGHPFKQKKEDRERKRIEREKEVWRRCPSFSAVRRQRKRIESCSFADEE
jgi:hypothetical protein